jgi:hypothetical protein
MRSVFSLILATLFGIVVGLGAALVALEAEIGFYRVSAGPWTGSPRAGGVAADPYTRALLVRTGELPVGGGEGVTFIARRDDDGRLLSPACVYRVVGEGPPTRWWTLTVYTAEGRLIDNAAGRHGFTSSEVTRSPSGGFDVAVGRRVQPGDWLPVEGEGPFKLVMRLYDTPLATQGALAAPTMPAIRREGCA